LRDVITGAASSHKDDTKVTAFLLKSGGAHDEFLSEIIDKNDTASRAS